jgi:hypothetical protein
MGTGKDHWAGLVRVSADVEELYYLIECGISDK